MSLMSHEPYEPTAADIMLQQLLLLDGPYGWVQRCRMSLAGSESCRIWHICQAAPSRLNRALVAPSPCLVAC
jgi:hypothetical protein